MFASLEKKAGAMCLGIFLAVIILGKMFGGSLKGLIPLGACLGSGVWLWMKEVVRSGREVEWSSETERGQTVRVDNLHGGRATMTDTYRLLQTSFPNQSNG